MNRLSRLGLASVFTVSSSVATAQQSLDEVLAGCHDGVRKWASVVRVIDPESAPRFTWFHYRDSAEAVDFWPASTIKLYTVVAAVEWLNREKLPLESTVVFSRQAAKGGWIQDCARTVPEMVSEVFRRSSNEDYTLLLRMIGIDAINTEFLIPAKGFPHSALMRDYVTYRPIVYENDEPQRIIVIDDGGGVHKYGHTWSGKSYAQQRGATVLSSTTGNCTSTRELAECLRRVVFHERIPANERYAISGEQARWIRDGDPERGVIGLDNKLAGAFGWKGSGEKVFPEARFFHKAGQISSYSLDLCYLSDAASDNHLILALAAKSGDEKVVQDMARAIYAAAKRGGLRARSAAGAAASRPKHSLQDQLVRHFIEIHGVELPQVRVGVAPHSGSGGMALLARQRDGKLVAETLERKVPAAADERPPLADVPLEVEEQDAAKNAKGRKRAKNAKPAAGGTLSVALRRPKGRVDGIEVSIRSEVISTGDRVDLAAVRLAFESRPKQVFLVPDPDVELGHVLAVVAEAQAVGAHPAFSGGFARNSGPDDVATVREMPEKLGWKRDEFGLHSDEVLMCFDREELWGKLSVLLQEFAYLRVWRLGFVGIDANGARTKVLVPLAADPSVLRKR